MHGCFSPGMLPDPSGYVIADLTHGDEVVIKAGAGLPEQEQDVTDIIIHVDGMSALTATGIVLMCTDGRLVKATDNHFEPGTFEISEKALAVLAEFHSWEGEQ